MVWDEIKSNKTILCLRNIYWLQKGKKGVALLKRGRKDRKRRRKMEKDGERERGDNERQSGHYH